MIDIGFTIAIEWIKRQRTSIIAGIATSISLFCIGYIIHHGTHSHQTVIIDKSEVYKTEIKSLQNKISKLEEDTKILLNEDKNIKNDIIRIQDTLFISLTTLVQQLEHNEVIIRRKVDEFISNADKDHYLVIKEELAAPDLVVSIQDYRFLCYVFGTDNILQSLICLFS